MKTKTDIYKCKKCGNIIHKNTSIYGSGLCKKCCITKEERRRKKDFMLGKIPWNKNKTMSEEFCKKVSSALKGKPSSNKGKKLSEEWKKNLSIAHTGYIMPEEQKIRISISNKGKKRSEDTKKRISLANKGRKSHFFGKPAYHSKWVEYKNINFRSSWEVAYAKYLEEKGIKWLYESKTFDLGDTTYTPDFYLPETNEYIEIKGWWRYISKQKFELFKKIYLNIKINVLYEEDLNKLNILNNEK